VEAPRAAAAEGRKRKRAQIDADLAECTEEELVAKVEVLKRDRHQLFLMNKTLKSLVQTKSSAGRHGVIPTNKESSAIEKLKKENEDILRALKILQSASALSPAQLEKVIEKCLGILSSTGFAPPKRK